MIDCPGRWTNGPLSHTRGMRPSISPSALRHGAARRGVAFVAHERHLLLRVRVHRALGPVAPPMPGCLMFHVVTSGRCRLEVGKRGRSTCGPGLALVPHGEGHRLASERGAPAAELFDSYREQVSERYEILRHGGGGARDQRWSAAAVRFDHPAAHQLVALLPQVIQRRGVGSPEPEWIHSTLRFMAAEARELRPGGETVITRLADILVIQAIRAWIAHDPAARRAGSARCSDRAGRPRDGADPPRAGARLDGRRRSPPRSRCRARRSRRASRSWSASRRCTTSTRWRMHARADAGCARTDAALGELADRPRLRIGSRVQPRLQADARGAAGRGPQGPPAAGGCRSRGSRAQGAEWKRRPFAGRDAWWIRTAPCLKDSPARASPFPASSSTPASAAAARRCCCCTAIRRPTRSGIAVAAALARALHRGRRRPARLRRLVASRRPTPTTPTTASARWRRTWSTLMRALGLRALQRARRTTAAPASRTGWRWTIRSGASGWCCSTSRRRWPCTSRRPRPSPAPTGTGSS